MGKPKSQNVGLLRQGVEILSAHDAKIGILAYSEAAEQIEKDPNLESAEKIKQLRGSAERMTQLDEISAMTTGLVSVMAKLEKKKKGSLDKIRIDRREKENPGYKLQNELMKNGMMASLTLAERAAVEELPKVLDERGDTSHYFMTSWNEIVDQAEVSAGGWTEKIKQYVIKDPVATIGMLAIGIGLAWASYEIIKKLRSSKGEKEGPPPKGGSEAEKSSWINKKILIPIAILIAGSIMGADKLKRLLAGLGIEDLQELLMKGESIPEDVRKQIEEQAKKIEELELTAKAKAAAGAAGAAVAGAAKGAKEKVTGVTEKTKEGIDKGREYLSDEEVKKNINYSLVSKALVWIYCIDTEKFREIQSRISASMMLLLTKKVSTIIIAYKKAVENKKEVISPQDLNIKVKGVDEIALFHACAIISKANDGFQKITPMETGKMELKDFLVHLSKDPTLEISNNVQASLGKKFQDLKVHSLSDLIKSAEEMFDGEEIGNIFEQNKERYLTILAERYDLEDFNTFTDKEKTDFVRVVIEFYDKLPLDQNIEMIEVQAAQLTSNPKVIKAIVQFASRLKENVQRVLDGCIKRYDIPRKEKKFANFDRVLSKHLKLNTLNFKHGMQMALLAEGINFDSKEADYEVISKSKDIAMIYLLLNILKDRDPDLFALYRGNIAYLIEKGDFEMDVNIPFTQFLPYFGKLFEMLWKKAKRGAGDLLVSAAAISTLDQDPDKIEKLANMGVGRFLWETAKKGAKEAFVEIPLEVVTILRKDYEDEINSETTGADMLKMVEASGGTIFLTEHSGGVMGLIELGGEYSLFKPLGIGVDTIKAGIHGPGTMAKTYIHGAAPYIVISAAWSGAAAVIKRQTAKTGIGVFRSILSGAVRGATLPVSLPFAIGKGVRGVGRFGKRLAYTLRYGRGNLNTLEQGSRLFLEYSRLAPAEKFATIEEFKAGIRRPDLPIRRLINADIYARGRLSYGHIFAKTYNALFDVNPVLREEGIAIQHVGQLQQARDTAERILTKLIPRLTQIKGLESMNAEQLYAEFVKIYNESGEVLTNKELEYIERRLWKLKTDSRGNVIRIAGKAERIKPRDWQLKKLKRTLSSKPSVGIMDRLRGLRGKAPAAAEVAAAEVITLKVTKLGEGRYNYLGEEFKIRESDIDDAAKKLGGNRGKAIEKLAHKQWAKPSKISEGPKGRLYRYRGGEFVLSKAEYSGKNAAEIKKLCEARYLESVQITGTRIVKGTKIHEYKIGNKWVRMGETPAEIATIKREYLDELKRTGQSIEYRDLKNTKLLKYLPVLKEMLGPAVAVSFIYHLETAPNKRQAIIESAVGFGAFMAGAKGMEKLTRSLTPKSLGGMIGKGGLILLGGFATAVGISQPIEEFIDEMLPKFAGQQQISSEIISIFEKVTSISISRKIFASLGTGILRKGIEKVGWKGLGVLLDKKIKSTVLKKVAQFASKSLGKKVIAGLGIRGATMAALLADDATVIGILDDVVVVGLAIWTASDIYDIVQLSRKAYKIKSSIEAYSKMPIADVQPSSKKDEQTLLESAEARGMTLEQMNDEQLMDLITSIGDIKLKITRQGASGYEEYHFARGEVLSAKIKAEDGEVLQITDEELNEQITLPPPEEFQPWDINYNLPKDKLMANLRMALLYTKSECGWTKMDHKIIDDKTIEVKRIKGDEKMRVVRTGNTWKIENYRSGLTLFQAVAMANLINKVSGIFKKEHYTGASDRPFEIDGDDIDFDKSGTPIDLTILSGDMGWLEFFRKNNISKTEIVALLNKWYASEYHYAYAA